MSDLPDSFGANVTCETWKNGKPMAPWRELARLNPRFTYCPALSNWRYGHRAALPGH
jgi:hypothetical protein